MTQQFRLAVVIVLVAALGYPLVVLASGSPRFPTRDECIVPAVEGQPVDLVFGRFDDPGSASDLAGRVVAVGFTGTESAPDGCGRWKVVLENVPSHRGREADPGRGCVRRPRSRARTRSIELSGYPRPR